MLHLFKFQKKLPQIIIKYGKLLDPFFIFYCQNSPDAKKEGWDDWIPLPQEKIYENIKSFREEWKKDEKKYFVEMGTATILFTFACCNIFSNPFLWAPRGF